MAKETKIGLLVGMGFIVCFAIILSNRGEVAPTSQRPDQEVAKVIKDTPAPTQTTPSELRSRDLDRRANANRRHPNSNANTNRSRTTSPDAVADRSNHNRNSTTPHRSRTTNNNDVASRNTQRTTSPIHNTPVPAEQPSRFNRRGEPVDSIMNQPLPEPIAEEGPTPAPEGYRATQQPAQENEENDRPVRNIRERRPVIDLNSPEDILAAVEMGPQYKTVAASPQREEPRDTASSKHRATDRDTRRAAADNIHRTANPLNRNEPVASPLGTHKIVSGDNLSKIASRYYGKSSKDVTDAIYAANKDKMSSPNVLIPGREIVLPAKSVVLGEPNTTQQQLAVADSSVPADNTKNTSSKPQTVRARKALGEYEIQSGDNLTKIAKAHYNSTSKSVIDAIYEANRSTLSSPNDLHPGRKIVLPQIPTASAKAERQPRHTKTALLAATPSPKTVAAKAQPEVVAARPQSKTRVSKESEKWRWYQLKKGELYSTVAARELGSSSRWQELAELNKDIFPDPNNIRYGVSIRLPIDGANNKAKRSLTGSRR